MSAVRREGTRATIKWQTRLIVIETIESNRLGIKINVGNRIEIRKLGYLLFYKSAFFNIYI